MTRGLISAIVMTAALPAAAAAQSTVRATPAEQQRYDQIRVMEGTLTGSVSLAANQVARAVQSNTPGASVFTGTARAKGFTLDGYGAFFYVEIPALDLNLVLTLETLERNAQRRSESQRPGGAQSVNQLAAEPRDARENPQGVPADDPGQQYRDAVRRCLIDAMLDNSKSMDLGPEEWLTVAARGSEAGLIPGEVYQLSTLVLRVKGSDIAAFLAGRLSKDEARQKVEVRQF